MGLEKKHAEDWKDLQSLYSAERKTEGTVKADERSGSSWDCKRVTKELFQTMQRNQRILQASNERILWSQNKMTIVSSSVSFVLLSSTRFILKTRIVSTPITLSAT